MVRYHQSFEGALEQPLRFSVGASTAGIKGEVAYRFAPRWAVRGFVGGGLTVFVDGNVAGVNYDANLRLGGAAANINYYPFRNRFRMSAGIFFTDTLFDGTASGTINVGGTDYDATIRTRIELADKYAPILSVGYELPITKRLILTADAGAIYIDNLSATITPLGGEPIDVSDIANEIAEIAGPQIPFYPFVSLNLAFVF
ncbi:MAG: hypothetical protein HRU32_04840 [Rhodobacteraceae bacterium]|nr:hypothetical protein [Paracoccaceae bacterium]